MSGGFGGSGDPVQAIHVDAADALSLLDYVEALEGLYRMHQQTETREMLDLKAERAVLTDQVKALQADENSWQSGYDKGREMGAKHRSAEVEQLRAQVEALRGLLAQCALSAETLRIDSPALALHCGFGDLLISAVQLLSGVNPGHGVGSASYPSQQAAVEAAIAKEGSANG